MLDYYIHYEDLLDTNEAWKTQIKSTEYNIHQHKSQIK